MRKVDQKDQIMIRPVVSGPGQNRRTRISHSMFALVGTGVTSEKWTSPAVLKVQSGCEKRVWCFGFQDGACHLSPGKRA